MTLTEFLLARIAEDESVARGAANGPWSYGNIESVAGGSLYDPGVMIASIHWDDPGDAPDPRIHRSRSEEQADRTGEHIARHDPSRVLAECEAKRRIVAWHRLISGVDSWDKPVLGCGNCCACGVEGEYLIEGPCLTVRLLALPYADHPDYDPAWRT